MHADDAYANLVLPPLLTERRITGRDAAFATELLAGTCRLAGHLRPILVAASGRALGTLQPAVLDLLRLGCHQLLSMRVPTHAAVAATVDLAAATVGERVTGLVNAVLRKVAARSYEEWTDELAVGLDDRRRAGAAHRPPAVDRRRRTPTCCPPTELETALLADNDSAAVSLVVRPGSRRRSTSCSPPEPSRAAGARTRRAGPGNPAELAAVRHGHGRGAGRGLPAGGLGSGPDRCRRPRAAGGWTCAPDRAASPPC